MTKTKSWPRSMRADFHLGFADKFSLPLSDEVIPRGSKPTELHPYYLFNREIYFKDYLIIGVDEVGRGSFFGPLMAGAACTGFMDIDRFMLIRSYYRLPKAVQKLFKPLMEKIEAEHAQLPISSLLPVTKADEEISKDSSTTKASSSPTFKSFDLDNPEFSEETTAEFFDKMVSLFGLHPKTGVLTIPKSLGNHKELLELAWNRYHADLEVVRYDDESLTAKQLKNPKVINSIEETKKYDANAYYDQQYFVRKIPIVNRFLLQESLSDLLQKSTDPMLNSGAEVYGENVQAYTHRLYNGYQSLAAFEKLGNQVRDLAKEAFQDAKLTSKLTKTYQKDTNVEFGWDFYQLIEAMYNKLVEELDQEGKDLLRETVKQSKTPKKIINNTMSIDKLPDIQFWNEMNNAGFAPEKLDYFAEFIAPLIKEEELRNPHLPKLSEKEEALLELLELAYAKHLYHSNSEEYLEMKELYEKKLPRVWQVFHAHNILNNDKLLKSRSPLLNIVFHINRPKETFEKKKKALVSHLKEITDFITLLQSYQENTKFLALHRNMALELGIYLDLSADESTDLGALTDSLVKHRDSKCLKEEQRARIYQAIKDQQDHLCLGLGKVSAADVDKYGVQVANYKAMYDATMQVIEQLNQRAKAVYGMEPEELAKHIIIMVDGDSTIPGIPPQYRQFCVVKGDTIERNMSVASIMTKHFRDNLIIEMADKPEFSVYGLKSHKGYHTDEHFLALDKYGPSIEHRWSYRTIKDHFGERPEDIAKWYEENKDKLGKLFSKKQRYW